MAVTTVNIEKETSVTNELFMASSLWCEVYVCVWKVVCVGEICSHLVWYVSKSSVLSTHEELRV